MAGAASSPESKLYGGKRRGAVGRRYTCKTNTALEFPIFSSCFVDESLTIVFTVFPSLTNVVARWPGATHDFHVQ